MSAAMLRPEAKGWCPGAYRPMMSGDGLVVRVRPMLAQLSRKQALGLCELAERYGSGVIDLTSRANLQIRGVGETDHETLLQALNQLDLLPDDPAIEARRNILMPFDWAEGDVTHKIASELIARLAELPELPAKTGFAIDTGLAPLLNDASADFRLERGAEGLLLRADGAVAGRPVTLETAIDALLEMAEWFATHMDATHRRMHRLLRSHKLPADWTTRRRNIPAKRPKPGAHPGGALYGAAFGQIDAAALRRLLTTSTCRALRVTPWRLFQTVDAAPVQTEDFITTADDPLLAVDACPGAPLCNSAQVDTRQLAHALAGRTQKPLHISGCAKGCARPRATALTLVGRDGVFDLVKDGQPWDQPSATGLTPSDLTARIGDL